MCDPLPCLVFFGLVSFTSIPFLYIAIIVVARGVGLLFSDVSIKIIHFFV